MSDAGPLLFLVLMLLVFWFVLMRPARNQQKRTQQIQRDLEVGTEVVLTSGIFGTVQSLEDARIQLEVAPGVQLTVARQAVVRVVEPEVDQPADKPEPSDHVEETPTAHDPDSSGQGKA